MKLLLTTLILFILMAGCTTDPDLSSYNAIDPNDTTNEADDFDPLDETVGIGKSQMVKKDPNNPFAGFAITEDNRWNICVSDDDITNFYCWATALADLHEAKNQWYVVSHLYAIYNEMDSDNPNREKVRTMTMQASIEMLENWPETYGDQNEWGKTCDDWTWYAANSFYILDTLDTEKFYYAKDPILDADDSVQVKGLLAIDSNTHLRPFCLVDKKDYENKCELELASDDPVTEVKIVEWRHPDWSTCGTDDHFKINSISMDDDKDEKEEEDKLVELYGLKNSKDSIALNYWFERPEANSFTKITEDAFNTLLESGDYLLTVGGVKAE